MKKEIPYKNVNFLVKTEKGIRLHPNRLNQLKEGLLRLDNAEQYVLKAIEDKYYDCFNCPALFYTDKKIFLKYGQVWRYGITELGQKKRGYSDDWLIENGLKYVIQKEDNIRNCLYEERIKIFNYALLSENISRERPIIRPPGNKNDR